MLAASLAATALGHATPQQAGARARHAAQHREHATTRNRADGANYAAVARELEILSRRMQDSNRLVAAHAYYRLIAVAHHWPSVERGRAALALGYYEFQHKQYAQARIWFHQDRDDPLLAGYAMYWDGTAASAAGQDADAMALLGQFRRDYPGSVVDKAALKAYVDSAMDAKQPDAALAALDAYPGTGDSPDLLVRVALADELNGDSSAAALDFQRVYDLFPLSSAAGTARKGINRLRASMGKAFPEAPLADLVARAETLYENGQWRDAQNAWETVLDHAMTTADGERAALRVAECASHLTGRAGALKTLSLSDPALNAERWIALFNVYWNQNDEAQMKAAVNQVLQLSAAGAPAEYGDRILFFMGNYYWANEKRDQAVTYYHRYLAREPAGADAVAADWRIAWTAYLENSPDAATLLRNHIEKFPDSSSVPDALYWLGRLAQRAGDVPLARTYYGADSARFAETYFGRLARTRAAQLPTQADPPAPLPLLARIPHLDPVDPISRAIPADVLTRYERGVALRSIAFDQSAMLEFLDAYRVSHAPQLLIDAAEAAQQAKLYLTGAALVRQLVPDLEYRPMDSVPASIWRIVYPLPIRPLIDFYAGRSHFDPMLYASLIRQESGFEPDALSSAGAVGLAQLEPYTARKWSRILHLWYSYGRLTDPRYNLRVSSAYLQSLITMFGNIQDAVAAYNAGKDRVAAWQSEYHYNSPAEFVESIPFSQTRHYVEVVMNGAAIYRRLYEDRP